MLLNFFICHLKKARGFVSGRFFHVDQTFGLEPTLRVVAVRCSTLLGYCLANNSKKLAIDKNALAYLSIARN
jgi:hypothetical protein